MCHETGVPTNPKLWAECYARDKNPEQRSAQFVEIGSPSALWKLLNTASNWAHAKTMSVSTQRAMRRTQLSTIANDSQLQVVGWKQGYTIKLRWATDLQPHQAMHKWHQEFWRTNTKLRFYPSCKRALVSHIREKSQRTTIGVTIRNFRRHSTYHPGQYIVYLLSLNKAIAVRTKWTTCEFSCSEPSSSMHNTSSFFYCFLKKLD